jgi:S-adenosylmethionine:tRNA ribosyltransferase-isomerase
MNTDDLDFNLPPGLIAQVPSERRGASRLLHYRRRDKSIRHCQFDDLPRLLCRGDLLVLNDTKVAPARFLLRKPGGGAIDGLFLKEEARGLWEVMLRNAGKGAGRLHFEQRPEIGVTIKESRGEGRYVIQVETQEPALGLLGKLGRMPLPPYIKRGRVEDPRDELDRQRYQTIYAAEAGAVAAPTAGLHFTPELMAQLDAVGVERAFVTLHVGIGTFKPVMAERLEEHSMHTEAYSISQAAAAALNRAEAEGRRIIAVGTTTVRVLESHPEGVPFVPVSESTDIFIRPGYRWKRVHDLITNFHLPRSTLIALVAAMIGLEEQRRVYQEAIDQQYRFFSYGDAMFVEGESASEHDDATTSPAIQTQG